MVNQALVVGLHPYTVSDMWVLTGTKGVIDKHPPGLSVNILMYSLMASKIDYRKGKKKMKKGEFVSDVELVGGV